MATTPAPVRIQIIRELSGVVSGVTEISGSESSLAAAVLFAEADAVLFAEEDTDEPGVGVGVGAACANTGESPITSAAPAAHPASSRRNAIIMALSLPTHP